MTARRQPRIYDRWAQLRFSVVGQLLADPPAKGALQSEINNSRCANGAIRRPASRYGSAARRFRDGTTKRCVNAATRSACSAANRDRRVDDSVAPRPGELILQKTTSGPLNSTKLDQTLRVLGIDTVIVTGVVTDVCVAQTAREFGDRDFNAIVVEDACASTDDARHKAALETIAFTFGFVESTEQVIARL